MEDDPSKVILIWGNIVAIEEFDAIGRVYSRILYIGISCVSSKGTL